MDTTTIIYIVIAAIVGAVFTYFVIPKRGKNEIAPEPSEDYKAIADKLREETESLRKEKEQIGTQSSEEISLLKEENSQLQKLCSKNEEAIVKLNSRITQLEKELTESVGADADDVLKAKLAELNTIRETVSALENQLKEKDNAVSEVEKKFKKKISDLEEELEEKEDDIDELKKKSKKAQDELQQQIDEAIQKQKRTASELEDASHKLAQLQSDIERHQQSLAFIQEVLSAKRISDSSVVGLEKRVDQVTDYIRGDLRDCLKQAFDFNKQQEDELFGSTLETWAVTKKKTWIQGKTTIAFVGEFSAGKTSIVNRLLSNDDPNVPKLPTSMKATTAIPTYISGGIKTIYSFVTPDNVQKEISEGTFKRVNKEVLDNIKGVSSLIQYFVMTYRNPVLDNLSVLDTPGFSSNDSEDAMRTIDVINECDALFWVFDVNAGTVNRKSIDIIKKNLHKPLYIVINQIDTKAKSEVDKVEQLITGTLRDSGVKVEGVIRFSIKEPLSVMTNAIKSVRRDQSKENYIENIVNDLNEAINSVKSIMEQRNNERQNLRKKGDILVDQFVQILNQFSDNSQEASEIPQYNSRLFSKDDYRMSQEEYGKLINLLNGNIELCQEAANSYDSKVENTEELVAAYEAFEECKDIYNRIHDCKENLDKLLKKL